MCKDLKLIILSLQFVEMPNWCPAGSPANTFEIEVLLGPLLRLGCFADAFVSNL